MSFPPPDVPYDLPQFVSATDAYIVIVGLMHAEPDVEVLARSGNEFYRFCLPKTARVVREFWKNIGVTNVSKLEDGSYQDTRGGSGPYNMTGLVLGEDLPLPEEEEPEEGAVINIAKDDTAGEAPTQRSVGTKVVAGVKVEAPVKLDLPKPSGVLRAPVGFKVERS